MRTTCWRRLSRLVAGSTLAGAMIGGMVLALPQASSAAPPSSHVAATTSRLSVTARARVSLAALAGASRRTSIAAAPQGRNPRGPSAGEHTVPADHAPGVFRPGGASGSTPAPLVSAPPTPIGKGNVPGEHGFAGIDAIQQASVNKGADLEPPDQALCAGQGAVMEVVNNALAIYTPSGVVVSSPVATSAFFGVPSSTFLSDPRCYYDAPTKRWFVTEFQVGNGAQVPSIQYVAVSSTASPTGTYAVFGINTTDPTTLGCPCFGDYDQIGADANGFYIAVNEFGIKSGAYNGVEIYALSKSALEAAAAGGHTTVPIVLYRLEHDYFGQPYHVSPSSTPPGGSYAPNSELFVESNSDLNSGHHLAVYALSHTNRLASGGLPTLSGTEIASEPYSFPPNATQKPGPIPLGTSLGKKEATLQADFNAIQEVTYTNGRLYAEASTKVGSVDGIAWFVIRPVATASGVAASMLYQGYVANRVTNLLYPDLVVNATGKGYLAFSSSGPSNYPSVGYVAFNGTATVGSIHAAALGAAPEDGFTCYPKSGPAPGCRWGDYSGGVVMGSSVLMAGEYIPPTARDYYTNWGTYVWSAPVPAS